MIPLRERISKSIFAVCVEMHGKNIRNQQKSLVVENRLLLDVRPNRYDLLIELTMTPDMLPAYDASEPHHRWKETFGAHIQQQAIFDYE